jgi:hypothetical protein
MRQLTEQEIARYGFRFGPCVVTRIHNDPEFGSLIEVSGKRERIEIRVTASGLLRVGKIIKRKDGK